MESTSSCSESFEKSLIDLNNDCLIHLCSFLRLHDRLRLSFVSDAFETAIEHFIQIDRIRFAKLLRSFSSREIKSLLRRFGNHIKYFDLQYDISDNSRRTRELLDLIPRHCPNIEKIVVCYPWKPDFPTYQRIFEAAQQITQVTIVQTSEEMTGRKVEVRLPLPTELDNRLHDLFRNLPLLRSLDLSYLRDLTGRHLPKLKGLKELNLEYCDSLESKHLINFCLTAKLKFLNIINCCKLDDSVFEALNETQTDLEQILISNNYQSRNFHLIGRSKNLRHISFHDYSREALKLSELIEELVQHHANNLETFEITNDFTYGNSSGSALVRISEFRNLKKIIFPDIELNNDSCLRSIVRNCSKLENLFVNLYENGRWITEQTIHEIFRLKNLTNFRIGPSIEISSKLLTEIYGILREKSAAARLDLYLDERSIDVTLLNTPEYKQHEHLLRIHINEVRINDMLNPLFLF